MDDIATAEHCSPNDLNLYFAVEDEIRQRSFISNRFAEPIFEPHRKPIAQDKDEDRFTDWAQDMYTSLVPRTDDVRSLVSAGIISFDLGNYADARECFEKSFNISNDPAAWFFYGLLYARGLGGVAQSDEQAFKCFEYAAKQEWALSYYLAGEALLAGRGIPQDIEGGLNWLNLAHRSGDPLAKLLLSSACVDGAYNVDKNPDLALILAQSALKGAKDYQLGNFWLGKIFFNLGYVYELGFSNFGKAAEAYEAGSQLDNAECIKRMYRYYGEGLGVPRSDQAAVPYLMRAADLNDEVACHTLGIFYLNGIVAYNDQANALKYFKKWASIAHAKDCSQRPDIDLAAALSQYKLGAYLQSLGLS